MPEDVFWCFKMLKTYFVISFFSLDFPDSEKLILFITNVWSDIFVFQGAINKAMQLVVRRSASNDILACLSAYLNWEQVMSDFIVSITFCLHWSLGWLNQLKQLNFLMKGVNIPWRLYNCATNAASCLFPLVV